MIWLSSLTFAKMMIQATMHRERVQKTSRLISKMRKDPLFLYFIYSELIVLNKVAKFLNVQIMASGLCLSELSLTFLQFKPRRLVPELLPQLLILVNLLNHEGKKQELRNSSTHFCKDICDLRSSSL